MVITDSFLEPDRYKTGDAPLDEAYQWYVLKLPKVDAIRLAVFGAIAAVSYDSQWILDGSLSVRDTAHYIKSCIVGIKDMSWIIGSILASAHTTTPHNLLLCDGTTYLNSEYPELANALGQGGSSFTVPDLRDKFILGASATRPPETTGGNETHTLNINEIPAHTHTNSPHAHSEVSAIPQVTTIGAGAPQPTAIAGIASTGLSSIIIDSTGGSQAHNNMPPFYALRYCIVARLGND